MGGIYNQVEGIEGIPRQHFYLTFNGRCLESDVVIDSPCVVALHIRLPGGKVSSIKSNEIFGSYDFRVKLFIKNKSINL